MNMRYHINKRLVELCFLLFMMLCTNVEGYKDRKFIHQEIVRNQQRIMDRGNNFDPSERTDMERLVVPLTGTENTKENEDAAAAGSNGIYFGAKVKDHKENDEDVEKEKEKEKDKDEKEDDIGTNKTVSNITEPIENKLTFWSGFIDSLSMIFFVEFGDRVDFII